MSAPISASPRAIALPSPLLPPVTRATLPLRLKRSLNMLASQYCGARFQRARFFDARCRQILIVPEVWACCERAPQAAFSQTTRIAAADNGLSLTGFSGLAMVLRLQFRNRGIAEYH